MKSISLGALALRLGIVIILPLIFLIPVGVWIDRAYNILPFTTLGTMLLSACVSTFLVLRMVQEQAYNEEKK